MCPYPDMLFIDAGAPIDLQKSALRYFQSLKEKTNEIMPTNLRKIDSGTCVVFFNFAIFFRKAFASNTWARLCLYLLQGIFCSQ